MNAKTPNYRGYRFPSEIISHAVETGFAEVNGTRLYYDVAGTGDPIVLIHGNFGDRRY